MTAPALLLGLALALPAGGQSAGPVPAALPEGFPLSPVTWGGLGGGGAQGTPGPLDHHPVILVHDDSEGPEALFAHPGPAAALARDGFLPREIWAVRVGEAGRPLRSLEELTDDLRFFISSVLQWTGAPRVQLLAQGTGAVLAHATLRKYRLHRLIHAAVYVDGPFQGRAGCDDARCFGGEVACCALQPGALLLRRTLLPLEAPEALTSVPDQGARGHLRYLALGSTPPAPLDARTPASGGWMLDGAANLYFPELAHQPLPAVPEAWAVVLRSLSDPAVACDPQDDQDGDGFCAASAGGADCDDGDPAIHPAATEREADGVDQDCNGHDTDRRFPGWACEQPLPPTASAAPPPGPTPPGSFPRRAAWGGIAGSVLLATALGLHRLRRRRSRP